MTAEALPLVLATVFTAGGIAIQRAGRYADRVNHALGVVFSVVVALLIMEILVQALPQADGAAPIAECGTDLPKLTDRVQAGD